MRYVYVVTNPELGWDCVCGVYIKEEDAKLDWPGDEMVIHEQELLEKPEYQDEC